MSGTKKTWKERREGYDDMPWWIKATIVAIMFIAAAATIYFAGKL